MSTRLLTIAIVCKDDSLALSETLRSIQTCVGMEDHGLIDVIIGYSTSSNESLTLDTSLYSFEIDVLLIEDNSIYNAMNLVREGLKGFFSVYINCGDLVLNGFRCALQIIRRDYLLERGEYIYMLNTYHSDIAKYRNGIYVGRFSPRWYSRLFGMSSEHCGWIVWSSIYRNGEFDENLKFCADYKRMYEIALSGVAIRDLRKMPCAIAPLSYGFSSQHMGISAYLEECRVLLSLKIGNSKKFVGVLYRLIRIIPSAVKVMTKRIKNRKSSKLGQVP